MMYLLLSTAFAIPQHLTHQGILYDTSGQPLQGTHGLAFRIYDSGTDGEELWSETLSVSFTTGYYQVQLGMESALDSSIFDQSPIWLELEVDGLGPLNPRYEIGSVPFATIAEEAENLLPGSDIDAKSLSIDGNEVIDRDGNWLGGAIDWDLLTNRPSDMMDGDNDLLSTLVCETGQIVSWNGTEFECANNVTSWDNLEDRPSDLLDGDDDTLQDLSCDEGDLVSWDGSAFVCSTVTQQELSGLVDLATGSTMGGSALVTVDQLPDTSWGSIVDVPPELLDGDDDALKDVTCSTGEIVSWNGTEFECIVDAVLNEVQVEGMITNNALDLADGTTVGNKTVVTQGTSCDDGQILVYSLAENNWTCGEDTDTTLTASEVQAMVQAVSGLALQAGATVDGSLILTEESTLNPAKIDTSAATDGQVLTVEGGSAGWKNGGCEVIEELPDIGNSGSNTYGGVVVYQCGGVEIISSTLHERKTDFFTVNKDTTSSRRFLYTDNEGNIQSAGLQSMEKNISPIIQGFSTYSSWCGITSVGTIECGKHFYFDDGYGTTSPPTGTYEKVVGVGNYTFCGLSTDGAINCWGQDIYNLVSTSISGEYKDIYSSSNDICGISSQDEVDCWGYSSFNLSGNFSKISINDSICGIQLDNTLKCTQPSGSSGTNPITNEPSGNFSQVRVLRPQQACGLRDDGTIVCWGNVNTELEGSFQKIEVYTPSSSVVHLIGLDMNGHFFAWSNYNSYGFINLYTHIPNAFDRLYNNGCALTASGLSYCM